MRRTYYNNDKRYATSQQRSACFVAAETVKNNTYLYFIC